MTRSTLVPVAEEYGGIPVANVWHMLIYAWHGHRFASRLRTNVDEAPSLQALLAGMLVDLLQQRFRIGLGREYVETTAPLRGIRGRIDFARSVRERRFERGQAVCRYTIFDIDAPRNRVIKSVLERLIMNGDFGDDPSRARVLRARLRRAYRDLEGVSRLDATVEDIRRIHLGPNDADYRLMLTICEMLLATLMPTTVVGRAPSQAWRADGMHPLAKVFEGFVPAFLRRHLSGWTVATQQRWQWPALSEKLPQMIPDVVLHAPAIDKRIVLDTKFSKYALSSSYGGRPTFEPSHLYQLYAYLRTQEERDDPARDARGVLLYPSVGTTLRERFKVQEHDIVVATIDLGQPWQRVEEEFLEAIDTFTEGWAPHGRPPGAPAGGSLLASSRG